jgi:hypothetical protein
MSERFGIPDHSPQHAPDHALQNPTSQGSWAGDASWPDTSGSAVPSYNGGGAGFTVASGPRLKSVLFAVTVVTFFGPLGAFYVSILNGIAALIVTWTVLRSAALLVSADTGIRPVMILIPLIWGAMIPWAVIGVRRHNRRVRARFEETVGTTV